MSLRRMRARGLAMGLIAALALGAGAGAQDATEPFLAPLDTSETIAVYIAPGEADSAFLPHDALLARVALESWADAAEGRLAFRLTSDEAEALVRVYFIGAGAGQYGEMRRFSIGERRGAAVFIRPDTSAFGGLIARRAQEDALYRDTIVYLTCVHELGHALGLEHTSDYADIMYAFGYGGDIYGYFLRHRERVQTRADLERVSALSPGDVAQLRALYPTDSGAP